LLGNGANINFWLDNWCGDSLAHALDIPNFLQNCLSATVNQFISNNHWLIPPIFMEHYPQLLTHISKITIPIEPKQDELVWKHTSSGSLSLKDVYTHQSPVGQHLHWPKILWNISIPPSRSMLVWRLMHHKIPTDENLMNRGCHLPSMCSICYSCSESSSHIFFHCHFSTAMWNWFFSIINIQGSITCTDDLWNVCDRGWGPQCKIVIASTIINILNSIWFCRNQSRFNNVKPIMNYAKTMVIANTSISGNATNLTATSSMTDFRILKAFNVNLHPPKASVIKEVVWMPPNVSD
jgi:hypothetical protein